MSDFDERRCITPMSTVLLTLLGVMDFLVVLIGRPTHQVIRESNFLHGVELAERVKNTTMLRHVFASWLIALAVSPFTAPFCTCDLSMLSAERATQEVTQAKDTGSLAIAADASLGRIYLAQIHLAEPPIVGRARFLVSVPFTAFPLPSISSINRGPADHQGAGTCSRHRSLPTCALAPSLRI